MRSCHWSATYMSPLDGSNAIRAGWRLGNPNSLTKEGAGTAARARPGKMLSVTDPKIRAKAASRILKLVFPRAKGTFWRQQGTPPKVFGWEGIQPYAPV